MLKSPILTLILILLCLRLSVALAKTPTLDETQKMWTKTGVNFSFLEKTVLNPEGCGFSPEDFYGCVRAVETLIADPTGKTTIVLETDESLVLREKVALLYGGTLSHKVIQDFGFYKIMLLTFAKQRDITDQDLEKYLIENRKLKKDQAKYFSDLYDKNNFPLKDLIAWIKANRLTPENEAYRSVFAFNTYTSIAVDAHARIEAGETLRALMNSTAEDYVGTGMGLDYRTQKPVVARLDKDSPAEKAGMKLGDTVKAVDGKSILGMPSGEVTEKLKGDTGTSVSVVIDREGSEITFLMVRALVHSPAVLFNDLETEDAVTHQKHKVGTIYLRDFMSKNACPEFTAAVNELQDNRHVEAMVVDLRNNPGGNNEVAQCIAGLFLGRGKPMATLMSTLESKPRVLEIEETTSDKIVRVPVSVLVNNNSASAAELLSGVLQDYDAADIVGLRTFGKGSVQSSESEMPMELNDAYYFKTIARYDLPGNPARHVPAHSPQIVGIPVDYEIYSSPKPTATEKFGLTREADLSPIIMEPNAKQIQSPRPNRTKALTDCVNTFGTAKSQYDPAKAAVVDYQLEVAAEAATCKAQGK